MTIEIIIFAVVVIGLLLADFLLVGRNSHKISTKEAGIWTGVFVMISLLFAGFIYVDAGEQKATEFLTAYTIEKILSVDNLFVFVMVFGFFNVPEAYHHKVLFWGVFGAIIMRAIFIFLGVGFVSVAEFNIAGYNINFLILAFGLFLAYAGIKSGIEAMNDNPDDDVEDYSNSPGAKFIKFLFRGKVAAEYDGDKFFTQKSVAVQEGDTIVGESQNYTTKIVKYATPLLVVVGVVEFTDLLFAVDSIPAIFAVSKDPFILYSSNIFAILGLRSMYFLLANMLPLFTYLKHGLAIILTFIGAKMLIAPFYHIESGISLLVVLFILIASVTVSLAYKPKQTPA